MNRKDYIKNCNCCISGNMPFVCTTYQTGLPSEIVFDIMPMRSIMKMLDSFKYCRHKVCLKIGEAKEQQNLNFYIVKGCG